MHIAIILGGTAIIISGMLTCVSLHYARKCGRIANSIIESAGAVIDGTSDMIEALNDVIDSQGAKVQGAQHKETLCLAQMSVEQLRAFATANGIDPGKAAYKAELLDMIEEAAYAAYTARPLEVYEAQDEDEREEEMTEAEIDAKRIMAMRRAGE